MAKMIVCAVRDSAVQAYGRPLFVPTAGVAIRSFTDEIRKEDGNPMAAHPEDYELFELAEFDEETGLFASNGIRSLMRGKDAVA